MRDAVYRTAFALAGPCFAALRRAL
jgi:hypothetical protein